MDSDRNPPPHCGFNPSKCFLFFCFLSSLMLSNNSHPTPSCSCPTSCSSSSYSSHSSSYSSHSSSCSCSSTLQPRGHQLLEPRGLLTRQSLYARFYSLFMMFGFGFWFDSRFGFWTNFRIGNQVKKADYVKQHEYSCHRSIIYIFSSNKSIYLSKV